MESSLLKAYGNTLSETSEDQETEKGVINGKLELGINQINFPAGPKKNRTKRRDKSRKKWEGPRRGGTDFFLDLSRNVVKIFWGQEERNR